MGHGRTCLSALVASLLVPGIALRCNEAMAESAPEQLPHHLVALTTSQQMLATNPNVMARFLETARAARSAEAIAELPVELDLRVIAYATLDAADLDRTSETVRKLLASAGVLSRWRVCSGAACSVDPGSVAIAVLLLPVTKLTENDVHGEVARDAITGVPTVLIYVPPIAERVRAIRSSLDGRSNPALATMQTGHLVGAAIAHEVGHALGLRHGAQGPMQGRLALDDALALRTSRLMFTSSESASMRSALRTAQNSVVAAAR